MSSAADPDAVFASPKGEVLWRGRPRVLPCVPDFLAAMAAFAVVLVVGTLGLAAPRQWNLALVAPLSATYAAVAGLAVLGARTAGAGKALTLSWAFWCVVTAASAYTAQRGAALICPASMVGALAAMVGARFRDTLTRRYAITPAEALMSEPGRYTLAFPIEQAPALRLDPFGGALGEIEFASSEATLTARNGRVFKVPAQVYSFRRVAAPQRVLEAWQAAQKTSAETPEGDSSPSDA